MFMTVRDGGVGICFLGMTIPVQQILPLYNECCIHFYSDVLRGELLTSFLKTH